MLAVFLANHLAATDAQTWNQGQNLHGQIQKLTCKAKTKAKDFLFILYFLLYLYFWPLGR